MEQSIRQQIFSDAKAWVFQAGKQIRKQVNQNFKIDTKSNANDLVTEVDRSTEEFFADKIRKHYPEHQLLGEEGYGDDVESLEGTIWIVDPIDGTMNFVHQKRNFAISVGVYHDGIGEIGIIYNVMEDVIYTAIKGEGAYRNETKLKQLSDQVNFETSIIALNSALACENKKVNENKIRQLIKDCRGTRSYGTAALEFAFVAEGILDGYITMQLAPWDFAAGNILLEEVGGITVQADGYPIDLLHNNTIIACNKQIYDSLMSTYIELK